MAQKKAEFTIRTVHRPGELARVLELVAAAGVNVLAFAGQANGDDATLTLVPDDAHKASEALKGAGMTFDSRAVVAVKGASGVGGGAKIARKLAEAGVNVEAAYASTTGTGESIVIFRVDDVDNAARILT